MYNICLWVLVYIMSISVQWRGGGTGIDTTILRSTMERRFVHSSFSNGCLLVVCTSVSAQHYYSVSLWIVHTYTYTLYRQCRVVRLCLWTTWRATRSFGEPAIHVHDVYTTFATGHTWNVASREGGAGVVMCTHIVEQCVSHSCVHSFVFAITKKAIRASPINSKYICM